MFFGCPYAQLQFRSFIIEEEKDALKAKQVFLDHHHSFPTPEQNLSSKSHIIRRYHSLKILAPGSLTLQHAPVLGDFHIQTLLLPSLSVPWPPFLYDLVRHFPSATRLYYHLFVTLTVPRIFISSLPLSNTLIPSRSPTPTTFQPLQKLHLRNDQSPFPCPFSLHICFPPT